MSSKVTIRQSKGVSVVGLLALIAGVLMILAGGVTWWAVSDKLSQEGITVSDDAAFLAGRHVNDPFSAFAQAEVINKHALEMSDGKTYAELEQDDPRRDTVMNASFLRASLFTSVVSFGVAALVIGLGVLFILVGWALRRVAGGPPVIVESSGNHGAHALDPAEPTAARRQTPADAPAAATTPVTPAKSATTTPATAAPVAAPAVAAASTPTEEPVRRSRSDRAVTSPSPAGERPESTTKTGVAPVGAPTAPLPTSQPTTPASPASTGTTPGTPPTTTTPGAAGAPTTEDRLSGWASPADRVPPVDGASDSTDTSK